MVSSTLRPHFTPGKDPVTILQEAGWAPEPVWAYGKSRPNRDSIPHHPARSQSLYRLCYSDKRLKIHLNIILPSTRGSSKWSLFPQVSPPKPCIHLSSSQNWRSTHKQNVNSSLIHASSYYIHPKNTIFNVSELQHTDSLNITARTLP